MCIYTRCVTRFFGLLRQAELSQGIHFLGFACDENESGLDATLSLSNLISVIRALLGKFEAKCQMLSESNDRVCERIDSLADERSITNLAVCLDLQSLQTAVTQ